MTYTLTSPLRSSLPPASGWLALLTTHGAYGGADAIVASYARWCGAYGIDPNLALGQFCHETGYGTSGRWKNEWNPSGLRITSNNTPPDPFPSLDVGIQAGIEHLCCHAYAEAACPVNHAAPADRYHVFHLAQSTIADIQTAPYRWAAGNPGQDPMDYVRSIVSIANRITGGIMSNQPTAADIGYPVEYHPAQAHGADHPITDVRWYIVHDTQGGYDGSLATLTGPNVSAHALIRRDGLLAFLLPITESAWAAGNLPVNNAAIQVELENADYHTNDYTDAQYAACASFFRWCQKQGMTVPPVYIGRVDVDGGPLPDVPGIIGHMDVPDGAGGWGGSDHHTDPGPNFDWPKLTSLIQHGTPAPPPPAPPPAPADSRAFPETGHSISGNIKGYWERFGTDATGIATSIELFGFPVTDLITDGPIPYQYFERQVLEDHTSEHKGVMGRRLGAAAAAAAGHTGPGIP